MEAKPAHGGSRTDGVSEMTLPAARREPPRRRDGPRELRTTALAAALSAAYVGGAAVLVWLASRASSPAPVLWGVIALLAWAALLPLTASLARSRWDLTRRTRSRVVRAVRRGMERGEMVLHYQPQIDLRTGAPSGVEVLLRWRRGDTLVPPGAFLPQIEASDLIGPLTAHVLDRALEQVARWRATGRETRVSVNLSAASLRDLAIVAELERLLERHGVPPALLTLEVTETSVLEKPEEARAVLDAISDLGVSISVDDFGTGYSSLLWLRIFPVAEVKIDRAYVAQLDGEGRAFVEGVLRLAHDIGLRVVAEGIEDVATLEGLQALDCDCGQGFLFARPMPAEELEWWIADHAETTWGRRETVVSIQPRYEEIDRARERVAIHAIAAGMGEEDVWDLKVATTEALTNAIDHSPMTQDGLIHLRLTEHRNELRLEVTGGGSKTEAPRPSDPHRGRGIGIMTALMDAVELRGNGGGSVIRLAKRFSPQTLETGPLR